jgi:hypothetical protein
MGIAGTDAGQYGQFGYFSIEGTVMKKRELQELIKQGNFSEKKRFHQR